MKKSLLLVAVQFSIIAGIIVYCGVRGEVWQNIITISALLLGLWAIAIMKFKVSILPDASTVKQLYASGPYTYVRHPMYFAVLVSTGAWVFNRPDVISIFLWLTLLVDLLIKIQYEEGLLMKKFPHYSRYAATTKKLIPNIY